MRLVRSLLGRRPTEGVLIGCLLHLVVLDLGLVGGRNSLCVAEGALLLTAGDGVGGAGVVEGCLVGCQRGPVGGQALLGLRDRLCGGAGRAEDSVLPVVADCEIGRASGWAR